MNLNAHGEAWAPGFATDSSALDCVTSHLALIVHMTWLPTALNLGFQKDNLVKKIIFRTGSKDSHLETYIMST